MLAKENVFWSNSITSSRNFSTSKRKLNRARERKFKKLEKWIFFFPKWKTFTLKRWKLRSVLSLTLQFAEKSFCFWLFFPFIIDTFYIHSYSQKIWFSPSSNVNEWINDLMDIKIFHENAVDHMNFDWNQT